MAQTQATMNAKSKRQSADDIPLVPLSGLKDAVRKVLSSDKLESDKQMAEFQAANVRKRQERKRH
jgi:hypothetical protein